MRLRYSLRGGWRRDLIMDDDKLTLDLLLDSLSNQDRDIITLWFIEGYTLNEIAKILSKKYPLKETSIVGPRKVGIRIHKILEKLRRNAGIT